VTRSPCGASEIRLVGFDAPKLGGHCGLEQSPHLRQLVRTGGDLDLKLIPCSRRPGTEGTMACNCGRHAERDGNGEQRRRNLDAERPSRLQIEDELDLGRLLGGISGPSTLVDRLATSRQQGSSAFEASR
jgi:hypothetical protein